MTGKPNAQRQAEFRKRRKKAGWVLLRYWVPKEIARKAKDLIRELLKAYRP